MMNKPPKAIAALLLLMGAATAAFAQSAAVSKPPAKQLERGRYLVQIAGCNDCHTPNYAPQNGKVDEKLWLTGDAVGWAGPWGTTYPTNLRILLAGMSEQQWLHHARNMEPRPPMPWFNVRAMSDADLKAIYAFTRSLGTAGAPAPAYVPPGTKAAGPVIQFPQ
ncbi:cytochrome c precursor [Variovorax sp. J22R133]|uniref:c-type cytochrome n=1 Tax=Variovorax brevis TaxID=3053503 RepID=UPI002576244E|nr:c-type cytochrome [Variovorax sp. J22R133]MDM0111575.1 cytochrome c precursor [Variovorax sp. J22R133]